MHIFLCFWFHFMHGLELIRCWWYLNPLQYGWTPVLAAAWGGREEIVKYLLKECNCSVNVRDIVRPASSSVFVLLISYWLSHVWCVDLNIANQIVSICEYTPFEFLTACCLVQYWSFLWCIGRNGVKHASLIYRSSGNIRAEIFSWSGPTTKIF